MITFEEAFDRLISHEGGYSDDLTVASKCTERGLVIYCPSYSIYPQWCVLVWLGVVHAGPTPIKPHKWVHGKGKGIPCCCCCCCC